jgi:hypothetical protein
MVIDVRSTLRVLMPIVSTVSIRREAADRAARSSPRPVPDLRSTRCPPTRPSHPVYETSAGDVRVALGQVARCSVRADAADARCSRANRGTCEAFADDVSESASRVHRGRPAGSAPYLSATSSRDALRRRRVENRGRHSDRRKLGGRGGSANRTPWDRHLRIRRLDQSEGLDARELPPFPAVILKRAMRLAIQPLVAMTITTRRQ